MKQVLRHISSAVVIAVLAVVVMTGCHRSGPQPGVIYACDRYTLTYDSLVEKDGTVARAWSSMKLTSDYRPPQPEAVTNTISFTFKFNGRLVEFADSSRRHRLRVTRDNDTVTYTPGSIPAAENIAYSQMDSAAMPANARVTFRLDMRPVLRSMRQHGYYVIRSGDTLRRADFNNITLAGSAPEISPEFSGHDLVMTPRPDSIYDLTVTFNRVATSRGKVKEWSIDNISSHYPRATLNMKLSDALYNMAITEIQADSMAAVSPMAVLMSLAYIDPAMSMRALRAQTKNGRIIPATNSYWPVDISRVAWILAAWEVYKVTGDEAWAREFYEIARLTIADDNHVNFDPLKGIFKGGIVPLNEADNYYPGWMDATDIYSSCSLSANVIYARAYDIMAQVASILNLDNNRYREIARQLGDAVNINLWLPNRGCYSQYLYGELPVQSPVTDNAGQALAVLYDVATPEMATRIFDKAVVTPYGTPAVWPCTGERPGMYNSALRAETLALWSLAAAKTGDIESLRINLAAQMRNAALNAGEMPVVNAFTGDAMLDSVTPTEVINSAACRLAMTFRVLAGISFTPDGISFNPIVPEDYQGDKLISGLRYRDADLSIVIHGTGDRISMLTLDGTRCDSYTIAAEKLKGRHIIDITMAGSATDATPPTVVPHPEVIPAIPLAIAGSGGTFSLSGGKGDTYNVYLDGYFDEKLDTPAYTIYAPQQWGTYAFAAVNDKGLEGYICAPASNVPAEAVSVIQAVDFGTPGTKLVADTTLSRRYVELSATRNTHLALDVATAKAGRYLVDVHYANGGGSPLYQRNCALRSLLVNGDRGGSVIMPQLGLNDWSLTSFSNPNFVNLGEGLNTIAIDYLVPYNINASGGDNVVLVDYIRLIRLDQP